MIPSWLWTGERGATLERQVGGEPVRSYGDKVKR